MPITNCQERLLQANQFPPFRRLSVGTGARKMNHEMHNTLKSLNILTTLKVPKLEWQRGANTPSGYHGARVSP